ncbi:TPA: hypothetical protein ACH3X2_001309 [Trebouxia sp. C0005]
MHQCHQYHQYPVLLHQAVKPGATCRESSCCPLGIVFWCVCLSIGVVKSGRDTAAVHDSLLRMRIGSCWCMCTCELAQLAFSLHAAALSSFMFCCCRLSGGIGLHNAERLRLTESKDLPEQTW